MFSQFPKIRPFRDPEIKRKYEKQFLINRKGRSPATSLAQIMESYMHRMVSKDIPPKKNYCPTLELGAGTLNHLKYEKGTQPYDIVEPDKELYQYSAQLKDIRNVFNDISEINIGEKYNRIISTAVLEHICNLPEVVARSGLLLKPAGHFRVAIPSEGEILWTLGWKLTTGLECKIRKKIDWGDYLKYEHVNTAKEIEEILRYFYKSVKMKMLGFSRKYSFYQFYDCKNPDLKKCKAFI